MLGEGLAYCTGCGKPRRIVSPDAVVQEVEGTRAPGQRVAFAVVVDPAPTALDPRYPTVLCGSKKRPGVYDSTKARAIIKARRARRKAQRERIAETYGAHLPGQRRVAMKAVR